MKIKLPPKWALIICLVFGYFVVNVLISLTISMNHPVELDNTRTESFDYLNENYDQVQKLERQFDSKYSLQLVSLPDEVGKGQAHWKLSEHSGAPIDDLKAELLITRPATTKGSLVLTDYVYEGTDLKFPLSIKEIGKWELYLRVYSNKLYKNKLFTLEIE